MNFNQDHKREDTMSADYKRMYFRMFHAVEEALNQLEYEGDPKRVYSLLLTAMEEAEEIYMETGDEEDEEDEEDWAAFARFSRKLSTN